MTDARMVRPSWWYSLIGLALAVAGASLSGYFLWQGLIHVTDGLSQVVVPGEKNLALMPHQRYTIFLERTSIVDGRVYSTTESVAGLTCSVESQASGNKISIRSPAMDTTYSVGGRDGKSVLEFDTLEEGVYRLACDYRVGTQGPQVVLAVGSGVGERILSTVTKSIIPFFGGGISGAAVLAAIGILRQRSKRKLGISSLAMPRGPIVPIPAEPAAIANSTVHQSTAETKPRYAGFWLRSAATLIDAAALSFPFLFVTVVCYWILEGMLKARRHDPDLALLAWPVISIIFTLIYFSLLESSAQQGTLGKMVVGLRVGDQEGRRLTFGRALGRTSAKYLSCLTFGIGFVLCAFTKKKQTLHDLIAGSVVSRRR